MGTTWRQGLRKAREKGADAKEAELKTDDRVKASAEAQGEIVPLQSPASSACKAREV